VPLRRGAFPGCIAEPKRIGRRAACTRHAACEAACPTGEAAAGKAGTDCYVCGRCLDACPVPGARGYGRRGAVR
jgi:NAD-dependent dihydropyrimidine dehydrogenase PreA subunit